MTCRFNILLVTFALCCLIELPDICDSARILGFFPSPSKSHLIIHTAIADVLAERGHDVTVFQTLPNFNKNAKYKVVSIDLAAFQDAFVSDMINKPKPFYERAGSITAAVIGHLNETLSHPTTQQFLKEHNKDSFDLLILGYFFNEGMLGLAAHFDCPVILSFMLKPIYNVNRLLGNPAEFAYAPTLYSGLKQPMNFFDRVKNFLSAMFESVVMGSLLTYRSKQVYENFFPADRYRSLDEMYKNVSLVFSNHHFSQGPIRPNVPALIDIGGIQIKEKPDPLPEDLAQILDNAKEGVLYFSLGSMVKGSILPKEKAQILFNVLSKLSCKVIWKWGDAEVPGKSKNIFYKSWLPQTDILAHSNVKLFLTHGGQGSIVESQYHGVPLVGMPLFGDQISNMKSVERDGFGLKVDYGQLTEESLRTAILEVLQNNKYRQAVMEFRKLYRDRPMSARQTVIYWTEYVLRHHGAKHLQSPALYLNTWQLLSLDVIAFLLAVVLGFIGVVVALLKTIVYCCCAKKATPTATTKQLQTKPRLQKNKKE